MIWLGGKKSHSLLILDGVLEGLKLICTHSRPRALSKRLEVSSCCSCLLSQSGCSFGGRFYSLEDTWHPDLGEPFGVMHCVMCHCEPQRSRRGKVFGKVSCRNMKQDCPDPSCDDPVLLPGHCCNSGRKEAESLFEFFQEKDDDLHKSYNDRSYISSEENSNRDSAADFVAVLTGVMDSSGVARARFTLTRTSLTFSITFQRINRPSLLTFLDSDGNTAFEFRVPCTVNSLTLCVKNSNLNDPALLSLSVYSSAVLSLLLHRNGLYLPAPLQSVMSSGSALTPGKTGGVGSAVFTLHHNGSLDYQVLVAGLSSAVVGVTIEMKPRRRSKRSVLYDITADFAAAQEERGGGRALGSCGRVEARHIHMLLQNELFINIATAEQQESELRGQIQMLPYNGLDARRNELPVPLAGQFVSPPVRTAAAGHAWVSVDEQCHLHYEIVVNGLSKSEDTSVSAHLHGLAEIGEMDDSSTNHKRLLTGFYGQQAQGVLKDISVGLLRHLDEGTAYIQVSTKMNPRGEIRGRIHVPNSCELGSRGEVVEEAEFDDLVFVRDPAELRKDPHTCFFEGEHHAHGSQWTPQYNTCFTCICQKKTVICDPVICPALSCPHTIQPEDQCCPICDEKVEEDPEGCYFEGDQKMHAPGTTWHPFVPPFGYIKCAVCTCKGSTGEVHCEKVTCPPLTCSQPIRRNPSDCCKECPAEDTPPLEDDEMMQADGTRHCKFGKNYYQNSEHWHPRVPLVGEMKCITCWCDHGVTKCQKKQCPLLSCSNPIRREGKCCPECIGKFWC
uniref:Chordin n=1 Tax=Cyprinus carpio TaxID=7962 RepID=A0A8C2DWF8_CYPCA